MFAPDYQTVAALRYFGVDARQIDGVTRPSHFTVPPERPEDYPDVYLVLEAPPNTVATPDVLPPGAVAVIPLVVRGELQSYYCVWRIRRP